ncbi:hypothetical protein FQR65_LT12220 [Abscondita terminalis]|nr:hypothetical protein FQR65_LT12220 [Abscondita terminalis]
MLRIKNFLLLLMVLTSCMTFIKSHDMQWIDPHEMNVNDIHISRFDQKPDEMGTSDTCSHVTFALEHYKRLITFILNNAAFDDKSSSYKGQLKLNIQSADYRFLSHFIREHSKEDAAVLRKIDQIMNRILTRSKLEEFTEVLMSWSDYIYFTFYNRTSGIILSCMFLLLISYKLLKTNFTIWSVVKYLIFIGWVFDFAFTWIRLLQEAEINKLADTIRYKVIPLHCDPDKMSIWQYMWFSISTSDECRQYHQTIYSDTFYSIAPLQVLSHQLGIIIYTPALNMGKAVGSFTSGILTTLPWGVNIIILPSLLLFTLLTIGILLSFYTETSFEVNLFHLFKVAFGNKERAAIRDVLTGHNLTKFLDVVHRNMIEEVRNNDLQSSNTENCASSERIEEKLEITPITIIEDKKTNIPENISDTESHKGNGDN